MQAFSNLETVRESMLVGTGVTLACAAVFAWSGGAARGAIKAGREMLLRRCDQQRQECCCMNCGHRHSGPKHGCCPECGVLPACLVAAGAGKWN